MTKVGVLIDEHLEKQFTWYEASLPLMERKKRGHFSTPPLLVEYILDACGYTSRADLAQLRVLDPACGSGNFLAGAAQRLLAFGERTGLLLEERIALVQRNLWGFDPDPISCSLAEMQLRTIINAAGDHQGLGKIPHIFLAPPTPPPSPTCWIHPHSTTDQDTSFPSLHIHQADSLALPWEEPCVDLLVANPPYLAAKNNDLSGYRFTQQRGQSDSYLLFLSLALQVVRTAGWIGLVLPDPILARANAARERARLLEAFTLHHLWHLSDVFAADVGAVVIIAQKRPPQTWHQVSWVRERWQSASFASQQQVQQALFSRQPGAEFRYLLSHEQGTTLERLRASLDESPAHVRSFAPLGEFFSISRGEELGRGNSHLTRIVSSRTHYPVLRGGIDVHPYIPPVAEWQIAREAITKPLERYLSPKLLIVKSTGRLQAALDLEGHIALQTLYLLHPRDQREDQLYFFLALLNSRLLREYVYVLHTAYKWIQPQIEQRVLARLPVPLAESEYRQQIIKRAKALAHACSSLGSVVEWDEPITGMYEELERAICSLYSVALQT
ncbi:MAG TPA: N-6 DNA methylase [Ktedonobacteraceae bacterium]|nr:N-6 DNA methylase [Ktedonobacteraceae bacterium]